MADQASKKWVDPSDLDDGDIPYRVFVRVSDAINLLWCDNPKLHNLGGVIESIQKYGFQELPKFDINLINVLGEQGAIKAGNGRIEALYQMSQDKRYDLPRGLTTIKGSSEWAMPILIGVDAESIQLATAYAVDSNNLTMSGGDFGAAEVSRLWAGDGYTKILESLAEDGEFPVSVDGDDLDYLLRLKNFNPAELLSDDKLQGFADDFTEIRDIRIRVKNPSCFEEAANTLSDILKENPEWRAEIH